VNDKETKTHNQSIEHGVVNLEEDEITTEKKTFISCNTNLKFMLCRKQPSHLEATWPAKK